MARHKVAALNPARAVLYVRVSTDAQDLGPDAQREAAERWAKGRGVEIVATHVDKGVSGAAPLDKRPALLSALEDLPAQNAGILLVSRRDRLARDVVIAAAVERLAERHGAKVLSANGEGEGDGPEAALLRGIIDVFASYERLVIRARTKAALAVKQRRGERTGGVPYGYREGEGGKLEKDEREQGIIATVRELRALGMTFKDIAARLDEMGATPRSGKRWHATQAVRICSRVAG